MPKGDEPVSVRVAPTSILLLTPDSQSPTISPAAASAMSKACCCRRPTSPVRVSIITAPLMAEMIAPITMIATSESKRANPDRGTTCGQRVDVVIP